MKKTLQLIAVLIIFPALLAIVGFWELERYHEYGSVPAVADVEVQHKIAKLEKLKVDVMKDSHITITVNGKKYGSSAAASMIQKEIDSLSGNSGSTVLHDKTLAQVVVVLCKIMIGAGILGALVGMLGLLLATIGGRLAYQSMDRLISIFSVCRKWLPFLLAAITLLLTLAVISLTVIEGVGTINALMNDSAMSKGEFKIRLVLLMLGCSLAYLGFMAVLNLRKAIGVFGSQPMVLLGRQVTEDQAAGLWEYVRNLAQRMGAPVPKNIVVGLNDGFFVTAHDIVLEPTQEHITGETLFIPLSWAVLLHKDEIEFILGHELGHFCGLDTEYSLRFLPIYNGMERSLAALSQVGGWTEKPAIMLGEFLFERFDYAVHYWGRKREYGADQLGASITGAGNRAAARALLRISSIMPIINEVMSDVARQPEKVPADLLQWLVERAREKGFEDPRNNLDDVAIHPTDTHPPT
ncbi:MAG: hypothetical protein H6Q73_4254, partial [Firmicutes bacterium]|nr:hypothetical protein [Bacillota bacterium]